jgi:hypothetical protein
MNGDLIRLVMFVLAAYIVGQSAVIAWRSHPMPWHQAVRFIALAAIVAVIAVGAANHWDRPVTGYTIAYLASFVLAAIGVRFMPTP